MDKFLYLQTLKAIRDSLPESKRPEFDLQFGARAKEPAVALALSLFLGSLGIDRFYIGSIGLGVLKLFTFGVFFILTFIDWFLIMGAARRANIAIASEIKLMIS
jgi:TM2 domain-containing membrane protein YozV